MLKNMLPFFKKSLIVLTWVVIIFSLLFAKHLEKSPQQEEKTLTIFTWSSVFSSSFIKEYEKQSGIKIVLDYYSSNEELLMKLKKTGSNGYDLIIPSDYAVPMLKKEGLLQEIDHSKLAFYNDINPLLLGHEYDPDNNYSIPLQWDICGFGINTDVFADYATTTFTWDHLFNPAVINYKIAMTNDPIEAFSLGSYYLFGKKSELSDQEALLVKQLLSQQKKHVEAYAVPRSDYILGSKNASLALSLSAYILRSQGYFPFMKFVVPEKSTTISIENVCIPKATTKNNAIYSFINFIYQKEHLAQSCNDFGVFPATQNAEELLKYKKEYQEIISKIKEPGYELFFCKHLMSEQKLRALWVQIKS